MSSSHRVWVEIVAVAASVACGVALLIATFGTAAGAAEDRFRAQEVRPAAAEQTYEGMVTCSRCGAKHSAAMGQAPATCARMCVHNGASFALVNGETSYLLDGDLNVLKKLAGQRARVVGSLSGNTIRVASVAAQP